MTDLDRDSLERILPSIPGTTDWADVMSRSRAAQAHRRRRVLALIAATLVVGVGTATAFSSVRNFVLHRGFIGLPPVGATPSAPESGELVLRWQGNSETHKRPHWREGGRVYGHYVGAWVYADGRLIWWRDGEVPEGANELTSGYLEQRLTPEGLELLRSEVVGLLDHSRALLEPFPADAGKMPLPGPFYRGLSLFVPKDYGSSWGEVWVPDGERFVRLQWRRIVAKGHGFEGTIATPKQLSALRRIDALLTDPTSVLPPSAWAVRKVRAYVPSHYAVCILSFPRKDASFLLSLLPTQAADMLRDNRTRVDGLPDEPYCSKLTTEEAREVADAVSGLEQDTDPSGPTSLVYRLAEGAHDGEETTISFDPYFPDGRFLFMGGPR